MLDPEVWELEVRSRGKYVRASGYGAYPPNGDDAPHTFAFWHWEQSPKFMRLLGAFEMLFSPTGEIPEHVDLC